MGRAHSHSVQHIANDVDSFTAQEKICGKAMFLRAQHVACSLNTVYNRAAPCNLINVFPFFKLAFDLYFIKALSPWLKIIKYLAHSSPFQSQTCVSFSFNVGIIAYCKPSGETIFSIMLRWVGGLWAHVVQTAVCNAWFVCPCCFPLFPRIFFYFPLCSVGLSSSLCSLLTLPPLSFPLGLLAPPPPLSS